jgi:hypothetical protein
MGTAPWSYMYLKRNHQILRYSILLFDLNQQESDWHVKTASTLNIFYLNCIILPLSVGVSRIVISILKEGLLFLSLDITG